MTNNEIEDLLIDILTDYFSDTKKAERREAARTIITSLVDEGLLKVDEDEYSPDDEDLAELDLRTED